MPPNFLPQSRGPNTDATMRGAPRLKVREVRVYERDVQFRMPFGYGVVSLTRAPQAFVRARVETENGKSAWGMAAELMAPKWFDKSPALSNEENFGQLYTALMLTAQTYVSSASNSAFGLSASNYRAIIALGRVAGLNRLTTNFGAAVLDRAVLDALCRLTGRSFYQAIGANLPGIRPGDVVDDLTDLDVDAFLRELAPRRRVHARHTVGLTDPITAQGVTREQRLGDDLPQTLTEVVVAYEHRYYKVKIEGEAKRDLERLEAVAAVLDVGVPDYRVTLDGNERFRDLSALEAFYAKMRESAALSNFVDSLLFIEQPLERRRALAEDLRIDRLGVPVMIDESDDDYYAFPRARKCGYRGVSSKGCKGLYKSIMNLARCQRWNRERVESPYFISGEDLSCQAGLAVQQDLALSALLGLEHVERNGHHYTFGMSGAVQSEQRDFRAAHPDLYHANGRTTCLTIQNGEIDIGSLDRPGFASSVEPRWRRMKNVGTVGESN